jgi:hypothetical protein
MNPRLAPLMAGAAAATTAALVLALRLYRPWQLRWGSTDEEVHSALPGDEVVPDPTFAATRAITVDAPPERVWPWITHMGFGRAGWYSYDLLDNFGRRSSERVIASLQEVKVGDTVSMGPGGGGLRVKGLEPGQWLLWWDGVGHSTWAWRLESAGPGRTRLLTRVRIHYRWTHPTILFNLLLVEPGDFPMMRKCRFGIKERAEYSNDDARAVLGAADTRRRTDTECSPFPPG